MAKKSGLLIITLGLLLTIAGLKCRKNTEVKEEAVNHKEVVINTQNLPPDIIKLNAIQEEIKKLTDQEVAQEIEDLTSKLKADNLLMRMNKNELNADEKAKVKDMLIRLSLLNAETNKRKQAAAPSQN